MIKELEKELNKQGIELEIKCEVENGFYSFEVELFNIATHTTIGFCRRSSVEEALTHLVAKCVGDVARTKALMEDSFRINPSDIEEV